MALGAPVVARHLVGPLELVEGVEVAAVQAAHGTEVEGEGGVLVVAGRGRGREGLAGGRDRLVVPVIHHRVPCLEPEQGSPAGVVVDRQERERLVQDPVGAGIARLAEDVGQRRQRLRPPGGVVGGPLRRRLARQPGGALDLRGVLQGDRHVAQQGGVGQPGDLLGAGHQIPELERSLARGGDHGGGRLPVGLGHRDDLDRRGERAVREACAPPVVGGRGDPCQGALALLEGARARRVQPP